MKPGETPCGATIWVPGTRYNLRRVSIKYNPRPCSYAAREKVGPLDLCRLHARLAREGLVAPDGVTCDPGERRDRRDSPGLLYTWARDAKGGA